MPGSHPGKPLCRTLSLQLDVAQLGQSTRFGSEESVVRIHSSRYQFPVKVRHLCGPKSRDGDGGAAPVIVRWRFPQSLKWGSKV